MRRAVVAAVLGMGALALGLLLGNAARAAGEPVVGFLVLSVVVAVCFQVNVDLPNGSGVPVGNAVAVALATLLAARLSGLTAALAIVAAASIWLTRQPARLVLTKAAWIAAAVAAAVGLHAAVLP